MNLDKKKKINNLKSVIEEKKKDVKNKNNRNLNAKSKILPKITLKNSEVGQNETARMRDLITFNSSLYTDKSRTMRNFNVNKNSKKFEKTSVFVFEFEKEKEDIENAISKKLKESEDINMVYEKVSSNTDDIKSTIMDFYVKNGKERVLLEENFSK